MEDLFGRIVHPAQGAVSNISSAVAQTFKDTGDFISRKNETPALRQQVDELTTELARLRGTERDNESLREAVGYMLDHPDLDLTAAKVIGKDVSNLLDLLIIDRGYSTGIAEGMPVVWRGGLAGRIITVTETTARILPITSTGSAVNVILQGEFDDVDGVLISRPDGTLLMTDILDNKSIEPGQFVITSGLGGTFPKGILVGQIINVRRPASSVLQEADVRPFVQPDALDTVQIIKAFDHD
jgi:rod shape-determining protein MreC